MGNSSFQNLKKFLLLVKTQFQNESIKYLRKPKNQLINIKELSSDNSNFGIIGSDLVLQKKEPPSIYHFLPFIVCISFLAGYNFRKLTN